MCDLAPGLLANAPQIPGSTASRLAPWLVAGAAGAVLTVWLLNTPAGPLGKADAIGYALCHRIDARSFHIGDRQFPLCARCTGIYLGVLVGLAGMALTGGRRAGNLPRLPLLLTLVGFIGVMGLDGLNSYLGFFPGAPQLYEPQNWLRLATGTLNGLALAGLIYPIFNQTMWADWEPRPALRGFRELAALVLGGGLIAALLLAGNPILLYALALLSAAGVLAILVLLNTTILLAVARRDNRAASWRAAAVPLLAGFTLAILQIGAVDAARFAIFRDWGGFPIPG